MGIGNREQKFPFIRNCIPQYMISDRLKFLFSVPHSFDCAQPLMVKGFASVDGACVLDAMFELRK